MHSSRSAILRTGRREELLAPLGRSQTGSAKAIREQYQAHRCTTPSFYCDRSTYKKAVLRMRAGGEPSSRYTNDPEITSAFSAKCRLASSERSMQPRRLQSASARATSFAVLGAPATQPVAPKKKAWNRRAPAARAQSGAAGGAAFRALLRLYIQNGCGSPSSGGEEPLCTRLPEVA